MFHGGIRMFEAKIKVDTLRDIVGVVSTLVDEIKLNIDSDGLSLRTVDPAHVAMVDLSLKAGAFDELKTDEVEIGIDIDKLKEVLKLAKSGDVISLKLDEDKNRLVIVVENITRWMSLVDTTGMSDPRPPDLNLPAKVTLKTAELSQGIRASESVSEHLALIASPDGFELKSEGTTDSVELKLPKSLLVGIECKEKVKSVFSLNYLSNMIKSMGTADVVTMNLGTNYPVKLEFDIASGEGHVVYLLAPRVENE
jgi:proliferating cell nuclear antigen